MPDDMTMVARVAKALSTADGMHPEAASNDDDEQPAWTLYVVMAKAAIEAMRNPSPEMEDWFRDNLEHTETGAWIWKGAIDAALKEQEGEKGHGR